MSHMDTNNNWFERRLKFCSVYFFIFLLRVVTFSTTLSQATGRCTQLLLHPGCYSRHIQQHKCPIQGKTHFLMYFRKLFPSFHCTYKQPQTKFGADTSICQRDWSNFHICKPGVLLLPFLKNQNCIQLYFFHICLIFF